MAAPGEIDRLASALAEELHHRVDPAEKQFLEKLRRRIEKAEKTLDEEIREAKSKVEKTLQKSLVAFTVIVVLVMAGSVAATYFSSRSQISQELLSLQQELTSAYKEIREARMLIEKDTEAGKEKLRTAENEVQSEVKRFREAADRLEEELSEIERRAAVEPPSTTP